MMKYVLIIIVGLSLAACNLKDGKASLNTGKEDRTERLDTLKFPRANGYVNDFSKELTTEQQKELDLMCRNYEKSTTHQLVVATIDDYKPYAGINEYAKDMYNEWGIGEADKDNGVLIVLCMDCQEVRITTGLGAEKILTNDVCDQIIDPGMVNYFEEKKPYEGLKYGIEEVIRRWK